MRPTLRAVCAWLPSLLAGPAFQSRRVAVRHRPAALLSETPPLLLLSVGFPRVPLCGFLSKVPGLFIEFILII